MLDMLPSSPLRLPHLPCWLGLMLQLLDLLLLLLLRLHNRRLFICDRRRTRGGFGRGFLGQGVDVRFLQLLAEVALGAGAIVSGSLAIARRGGSGGRTMPFLRKAVWKDGVDFYPAWKSWSRRPQRR